MRARPHGELVVHAELLLNHANALQLAVLLLEEIDGPAFVLARNGEHGSVIRGVSAAEDLAHSEPRKTRDHSKRHEAEQERVVGTEGEAEEAVEAVRRGNGERTCE